MKLPLASPPESLCLLRLSAVGDISHTLPVVRTIQTVWPQTRLTWIIGRSEYALVGDIPGIEFIIFDKARRGRAYFEVDRALRGRHFDVLLHMQMSIRSSLISLFINADIKLGFDRERAKDLQWLFTSHRIAHREREHVVDSFFGFTEALGIQERQLRWDIPIPGEAMQFAEERLSAEQPILVISPCSSMAYRNWTARGYAAVANYAMQRYGMQVVITGASTPIEREYAAVIASQMKTLPLNLVGRTNLKQLLAIMKKAAVVLAPDSGPAHLATAVGTPVIGLYACTNPDRARPYLSAEYVVNRYPEAIAAKFGKSVEELPWGTRVRDAGTMERIMAEDVISMLDKAMTDFQSEQGNLY